MRKPACDAEILRCASKKAGGRLQKVAYDTPVCDRMHYNIIGRKYKKKDNQGGEFLMENKMFCYQCQETAGGKGCTSCGVCGKDAEVAAMQDLLLYVTKGLAEVLCQSRIEGKEAPAEAHHLVVENLFMTVTNVNFDKEVLAGRVERTIQVRNEQLEKVQVRLLLSEAVMWNPESRDDYAAKAAEVGVLVQEDEDERSARELVMYGLKGLAAYTYHADVLDAGDDRLYDIMEKELASLNDDMIQGGQLLSMALEIGNYGMLAMSTLDQANTSAYGDPEMTEVNIGVGKNPGILVTGHDLKDLEMLLEQTKGTGVDVYTHGEMLPAHGYPGLKKYPHLVGNYGGAWYKQTEEFESFNGPILVTTNCLVPPKDSYKDRLYTTGLVGYPGVKHIDGSYGETKDFSALIEQAKTCEAPKEIETGTVTTGFGRNQVFELFDKIVDAVKSGAIKKFVVMAGCDGRHKSRQYYEDFAKALPKDTVILTAGCAKYRFNKLDLGDIGGIPRVIDAGQCNDSYTLIMTAMKMREVMEAPDINHIPVVYNISWYEQKAVLVLLTLLSLDVRKIHLGPTLPGFLSETIGGIFINNFKLGTITTPGEDVEILLSDKKEPITKDSIVGDLIQEYPAAADVLKDLGLGCVTCASALSETLEMACKVHSLELEEVLKGMKEGLGVQDEP